MLEHYRWAEQKGDQVAIAACCGQYRKGTGALEPTWQRIVVVGVASVVADADAAAVVALVVVVVLVVVAVVVVVVVVAVVGVAVAVVVVVSSSCSLLCSSCV